MSENRQHHLLHVLEHYRRFWGAVPNVLNVERGMPPQLPEGLAVLEFAPTESRSVWSYATCGMSTGDQFRPLEIFVVTREPDRSQRDILAMAVHYHHNVVRLDLHHRLRFGRAWQPDSTCSHGFLTRPHLENPDLEWMPSTPAGATVRFLWMLPLTENESRFAREYGPQELERRMERASVDFLNPRRASLL